MELVYAAMLLHTAKKDINEENVEKVLKAAGVNTDAGQVKALVASLKEVNIEEAISKAAMPVASAPAAASAPAHKEEKKKEPEGKTEEQAAEGLGALFG